MLQVKTILKKFVFQRNNKNLDFKKIVIPLFGKITNNQTKCEKIEFLQPGGSTSSRAAATAVELQLVFPLVRR
ncbi:hypothetical protein [Cryptosporidium hominis TU502]|uniref:hypothetical protein n=1 Tax=Cryptosporidium hominis (strain TU502) TaxID=353151 RepID=UPI000045306D|nr:hypothetical protein [Cryptosporidium hominis TU502]